MDDNNRARRVLVVDDEALIRWSVAETLLDHGFEVKQAESGRAALEAVASCDGGFDLVLLDFRLPDSSDLSLLARLRQVTPKSVVILMTAFSTPEIAQGALDLGAFRVVHKPFEMSLIVSLAKQAGERRTSREPGR